ncbi:transposase family protein [Frankia sp. BMG5.23]|uniref:transposase family protein n=1 Tax=Frankia sp. BMG5.23 TaxID=683305 RepID=UPI0004613482|nr:hypothetical protein BMG523Draft_01604 [Frankia sp. BMG5.23]
MPVGALSRDAAGVPGAGEVSREGIWERLDRVTDPRSTRGRVYSWLCLAAVWLCSLTAAGHHRVSAVRAWLARTSGAERARLRLPWDPFAGWRLPSTATIHCFLQAVDDGELAVALLDPPLDPDPPAEQGDDTDQRTEPSAAPVDPGHGCQPVESAVALDGKTSRHAKRADGSKVHLVGVASHGDGRLLAQVEVEAKTNETAVFRRLLRPLDLTNVLVTADALHTVRANLDTRSRRSVRTAGAGRKDGRLPGRASMPSPASASPRPGPRCSRPLAHRNRQQAAQDLPTRPREGPALQAPRHRLPGNLGLPAHPPRDQRPEVSGRNRRRDRPRPDQVQTRCEDHPGPGRHRPGFSPLMTSITVCCGHSPPTSPGQRGTQHNAPPTIRFTNPLNPQLDRLSVSGIGARVLTTTLGWS